MQRLLARSRPDIVSNQTRRHGILWTRILYLGLILAAFLWFFDLLLGSYVYLKSEGMVMAPQATVATEYPATVRAVLAREGERVTAGERIVTVSSQQVAERIAQLSWDLARLRAEEASMRIKAEKNATLVRLASTRTDVANDIRQRYEQLESKGILPSDKRLAAIDTEFRSRVDLEAMKTEVTAMRAQLKRLAPAIDEAQAALQNLRDLYNLGEIVAPIDGVVGRRYVEVGTVTTPGEPMMDLYSDAAYVLAYMPAGTLYDVGRGDVVTISWGVRSTGGRVVAIEPIATALPPQFRTAFKPIVHNQILRIGFDGGAAGAPDGQKGVPPLFTKVRIRGDGPLARLVGAIF